MRLQALHFRMHHAPSTALNNINGRLRRLQAFFLLQLAWVLDELIGIWEEIGRKHSPPVTVIDFW